MEIRVVHGSAYNSDIRNLRSARRANGTNATHEWVTGSHPTAPNIRLDVLVNLAFESNKHNGKVMGLHTLWALYLLAFATPLKLIISTHSQFPLIHRQAR